MRRREFIGAIGAWVAWPLVAQAQQPDRIRRIGVLMNLAADDHEGPPRVTAFTQALEQLGWKVGRDVKIDYRWAAGEAELYRKYAVRETRRPPGPGPYQI